MRSLLLAAGALLLALPAAAAAPTDLYLHLFGHQDMPMNTQPPPDSHAMDASLGLATSTLTCLPQAPGQELTSRSFHTYYAYPVPTLVDYSGESRPTLAGDRGFAENVTVRGEPVLEWYLSTDGVQNGLGAEPAVVPRVVVAVTLRAGLEVSLGNEAYNRGERLARGESPTATLAGRFTEGAQWSQVGGRDVYGFRIPLSWEADPVLRRLEGFNLRVDVRIDLPGCDAPDRSVMANAVSLHTSPGHRARLRLDAAEPAVRITGWHVAENATWTLFAAEIASAWGAYDLDAANVTLEVAGPAGALPIYRAEFIARGYEHGWATRPTVFAWRLEAPLPPGIHTATLRANDLQHPADPVVATFAVGAEEQPVPGPALPLLAAGVAAAAFLARRR